MPPAPRDYYPAGTPSASIYFNGLLCLCFDDAKECTVGVNLQPPSHALKVAVWRKSDCEKVADVPIGDHDDIQIVVNKPVAPGPDPAGVYVYDPTGTPVPDRESYQYWLDTEGPKAHNTVLPKLAAKLLPRFHIKHAFFATYKVSKSRFRYERGGSTVNVIENIALSMVADIFHDPLSGSIDIKQGGTPILNLPALSGDQYEMIISNACVPSGCSYSETGTTPADRNDFYLYYEPKGPVTLPVAAQLELVNYMPAGPTDPEPIIKCAAKDEWSDWWKLSDRAPCMPIIFGQSSTL